MRKRYLALSLFALFFLVLLTACSGGSGIRIASSSPSGNTVNPGAPITLTASGATDVTFAITSSTCSASGALSNATATTVTYTPPTSNTADCTETITATSTTGSSHGTITLTIKAITVSPIVSSAGNTTTFDAGAPPITLTANLNNEAAGSTDVVNWTINGTTITGYRPAIRNNRLNANIVTPVCGTLSATQTPSGQSVTYTPPSTNTRCTDTITASSAFNGNHSAPVTFTIIAPASQLTLTAPSPAAAGTAFSVTVNALDTGNNQVTNYSGTVHFTSSDSAAVLPADTTLSNGAGTFNVTLKTAGAQTLTVTDTSNGTLTATANIQVNPGAASQFVFSNLPGGSVIAGNSFGFTITAEDSVGNVATGYTGTVHFTTSDPHAPGQPGAPPTGVLLPADGQLTNGVGSFNATLVTAGSQTITATDTQSAFLTKTSGGITIVDRGADHLVLGTPANASPNQAFSFTVTAKDFYGNLASGYVGTVHFTSSTDSAATLPADYTFVAGDSGSHSFNATLQTLGSQTITAQDTVTNYIAGTSSPISVSTLHFAVVAPANATSGQSFNFTVTAQDSSNNTVTNYTGTVHFTSSDGSATLPVDYTFVAGDSGSHSFPATLQTAGSQTITATDAANSYTGTSGTIAVSTQSQSFTVSPQMDNYAVVGQSYSVALNVNGGTPAYTITSTGTLPPGMTFSNTDLVLEGTPTTAGTYTFPVNVYDSANQVAIAQSVTVTVAAAPNHEHDARLNGHYSCLVKGFVDNDGSPYRFAMLTNLPLTGTSTFSNASFNLVMDGGGAGIAGVALSEATPGLGAASGTVNLGSDNHGVFTFTIPNVGSFTYSMVANNIASGTATETHGVEIGDIPPSASGQHAEASCYLDTTSAFSSNTVNGQKYAVALDGSEGGFTSSLVGVIGLGGGNIDTSVSESDEFKADGTLKHSDSGSHPISGTYGSVDSTTGRFQITLNPGDTQRAQDVFVYIIDASRALALSAPDPVVIAANPTQTFGFQAGNLHKQMQSSYSNANLNNSTGFVGYWHATQYNTSNPSSPTVMKYSSSLLQGIGSSGGMTVHHLWQDSFQQDSFLLNECGQPGQPSCKSLTDQAAGGQTFTVAVASNGRAAFTPDSSLSCKDSGGNPVACPVFLYFYDNNSAYILSSGDGVGTGSVESQSSRTTPSGSYILYDLPIQNPDAGDQIGLFSLSGGIFDGVTDKGKEGFYAWSQPINDGGGTINYSLFESSTGEVTATQGGQTIVTCFTITTGKLSCISEDDEPTIHVLTK